MRAEWFVEGLPAPQGSKSAFVHPHTGRVVVTEASGKRHKLWRDVVHRESKEVPKFTGPVKVSLGFYLRRPRNDFNAAGQVKASAPEVHIKKPDLDKLIRSVCDSLTTAGVIEDDNRVVELHANKWYADDDQTGVRIIVEEA